MVNRQIHAKTFNCSNYGVTLTELLVASVIIGVIMIGVVSVDYTTRQSQMTTDKGTQIAMRAGAVMLDIMKNASLATGEANNSGIGITANGVCIRKEASPPTPGNYADDSWICFTQNGTNIIRCSQFSSTDCPSGTTIGTAVVGGFQRSLINNGQDLYLQVSLTTRSDPSTAKDPVHNPEFTLTSHSSPVGQGGTPP